MFTSHFYEDKIDDVAVSYLVFVIIIQLSFSVVENFDEKNLVVLGAVT